MPEDVRNKTASVPIAQTSNCGRGMTRQPLRRSASAHHTQTVQNASAFDFFKHLLPKNFDVEDLMIVLLLLLMAGDCQEDQNTALLTLVLYLFL